MCAAAACADSTGGGTRPERRPRRGCRPRPAVTGAGGLVAVLRGECLDDLRAAAMAVHVAEAANVHQDVKAEGGAGVKGAQGIVMAAAVAEAQLDDFGNARGGECRRPDRESGGRGGGWPSKGAWRPARLQEIRCARRGPLRGAEFDGNVRKNFRGGLREFGLGLRRVVVGLGVFDEGGRGADRRG